MLLNLYNFMVCSTSTAGTCIIWDGIQQDDYQNYFSHFSEEFILIAFKVTALIYLGGFVEETKYLKFVQDLNTT
jgi:hypothetical protein